MKTNFARAACVAALMSTTAIATAIAADAPKVSPAVGKPLTEAQKDLQTKDFKNALIAVQTAQAVPNPTPYETYMINQFLVMIEIGLNDMPAATKPAEDAADSPVLPDSDRQNILHNALALSSNAKDYAKAVTYGQKLDQLNLLDDKTAGILAIAYYELKDLPNAKLYAQKSIDMAKAAGTQPNEGALQIVMSAQAATDQGAAVATLEQIVVSYNRPADWDKLVNASLGKGMSNADALNLFRLLSIQGAMTNNEDYTYLSNLAETQRDFVEARNALQAGAGKINAGAELAKVRGEAASDEKIIDQAIAAAQKSKKGEDSMQIAQDLWGYGRYAEVESLATAAKAKGGIKDPGEADVLIGMAQVAQGKYDVGIATLAQVSGNAPRLRTAHLWTIYAQAKQKAGGAASAPAH